MRKGDVFVAIILLILCAFTFIKTLDFPPGTAGDPGPVFFPRIVTLIIAILGLLLLIGAVRAKIVDYKVKPNLRQALLNWVYLTGQAGIRKLLVSIILMFSYIYLMNILGFLLITPLFLASLVLVLHKEKIWKVVVFSLLTSIGVYCLFKGLFKAPLPPSLIDFL